MRIEYLYRYLVKGMPAEALWSAPMSWPAWRSHGAARRAGTGRSIEPGLAAEVPSDANAVAEFRSSHGHARLGLHAKPVEFGHSTINDAMELLNLCQSVADETKIVIAKA